MTTARLALDGIGDLYQQVANAVLRLMRDGTLSPGTRLPPARELAADLGLNANTVLRGYRQLASRGLVELRRGRGATVIAQPDLARLDSLVDRLVDEAVRLGMSRGDVLALVVSRL